MLDKKLARQVMYNKTFNQIEFFKKDGTKRKIKFVNDFNQIPEELRPTTKEEMLEEGQISKNDSLIKIFDEDAKMWKSVICKNIIRFLSEDEKIILDFSGEEVKYIDGDVEMTLGSIITDNTEGTKQV